MSQNIYCSNESEFQIKVDELKEQGYNFESKNEHNVYWYAHLGKEVLQRKGKCNLCNALIEVTGIHSHGRICESCNEVIYLEYVRGDKIRFIFRNHPYLSDATLTFYDFDAENTRVYFYTDIPIHQKNNLYNMTLDKVQEALVEFKNDYEIVTKDGIELYSFYYNLKGLLNEKTHIDFCGTYGPSGLNKTSIVNVYQGVEYSEFFGNLPIPESVTVYKDWNIIKDAKEILNRSGINPRPEYYSGRGATLSDLNDKMLERVFENINNFHGKDAGKAFVNMVSDIVVLSATDFIKCFFKLENNNWKWNKSFLPQVEKRGIEVTDHASAFGTVLSVLSRGNHSDDTFSIAYNFLNRHGKKTQRQMANRYNKYGYFLSE
jgi:hypothetical protein